MGVTLSAAASLGWWARVTNRSEQALVAEAATAPCAQDGPLFLPYLAGERTPHNDAGLRGVFAGLSAATDRAAMTRAVLEGVAFSLRDCLDALRASGTDIAQADVIGGGSHSDAWLAIVATALDVPLHRVEAGDAGAAFGAARLARLAVTGEDPAKVCVAPRRIATTHPEPSRREISERRLRRYRAYRQPVADRAGG
jgi:xylulokinase